MKRIVCLIAAVCVCFGSAFAWNAESFLSDGSAEYQPYSLDPVEDPLDPAQVPMLFSARPSTFAVNGSDNPSFSDLIGSAQPYGNDGDLYVHGEFVLDSEYVGPIPGFDEFYVAPFDPFVSPYQTCVFNTGTLQLPLSTSRYEYDGFSFPWYEVYPGSGNLNLDISIDVSAYGWTAVEFLGDPEFYYQAYNVASGENTFVNPGYSIFVDGSLVGEFLGETGGAIYQSSSPIQTIRFLVKGYGSVPLDPGMQYQLYVACRTDSFSITGLSNNSILDGFNDQAQNDINDHHAIESEWTGSMTENFNALDLSGFTFPGGLVAAFALITGIFNDLWNGMGDYKILYVFPLTLGVVLLLIGRISKFSDRSSSANSSSGRSSSGRGGKGGRSA